MTAFLQNLLILIMSEDNYSLPTSKRYNVIFRIIRCLDCLEVPTRKDNDCISLMTTMSDIND